MELSLQNGTEDCNGGGAGAIPMTDYLFAAWRKEINAPEVFCRRDVYLRG
jgi:hypothetical protein